MRSRKTLKNIGLYLFLTLSLTAVGVSGCDTLVSDENRQREANTTSKCIQNTNRNNTPSKDDIAFRQSKGDLPKDPNQTDYVPSTCNRCYHYQGRCYQWKSNDCSTSCTCP